MFWAAHGLHCEVQQASQPGSIGSGNLLNSSRDRDRLLQLLVFNEEFLVNASHQLALITSLPFVHTARRSYRLDESMSPLEITSEAFGWNLRSKLCKSVHLEEGEVVTRFP